MINSIKNIILKFISKEKIIWLNRKIRFYRNYTDFFQNYYADAKLYYKFSSIYRIDSYQKLEAKIILRYHSVEKGLIHKMTRPRFAKDKIKDLHKLLNHKLVLEKGKNSQVQVAIKILLRYYELHASLGIDIEEYFSEEAYNEYIKRVEIPSPNFQGIVQYDKNTFYSTTNADFYTFSYSRKSIRNFTGELVSEELLERAIKLSLNAPSVCNRQASKVYLVDDKDKIDKILRIQGGFSGFSEKVKQLLIVTNNRSYFYTLGERNQLYVDGGIFLMNLLYSLHYYKIANCPANWGKKVDAEKQLDKVISIPKNEKIICLVPIGIAEEEFKVPLSQRREIGEILYKI